MESQRLYSCLTCYATYTQSTHLRRHEASHRGIREFSCMFCGAGFFRSDTARRHIRSCRQRGGQPLPLPLKRGRRVHACDTCAIAKSACDGGHPCAACSTKQWQCIYTRTWYEGALAKETTQPGNVDADADAKSSLDQAPTERTPLTETCNHVTYGNPTTEEDNSRKSQPMSLSFLLNHSDPQNETIKEHFNTSSDKKKAVSCLSGSCEWGIPDVQLWPWDDTAAWILPDTSVDTAAHVSYDAPLWDASVPPNAECDSDKLHASMCEILAGLAAAAIYRHGAIATVASTQAAEFIFSTQNAPIFIQSYFDKWYPHCPILHKDTFDSQCVFPPLLAAVILMGAVYATEEDARAARLCFDDAEMYVLEHEEFRVLVHPTTEKQSSSISPLQAAFIIITLRYWDSPRDTSRRIRLQKYPEIIAAARNLHLPRLRHETEQSICTKQSAARFVELEEGIRLMAYIFLVDSSYTIFHQTPPRVMLSEMTGSMPCPDDIFCNPFLELCNTEHNRSRPHLSLSMSMSLLMDNAWSADSVIKFQHLSYLSLFLLVSGLHEIIFNAKATGTLLFIREALNRALERWKLLWDVHCKVAGQKNSDVRGFYKNSIEYWHLAKLFLEEDIVALGGEDTAGFDLDSTKYINDFLKKFGTLHLDE